VKFRPAPAGGLAGLLTLVLLYILLVALFLVFSRQIAAEPSTVGPFARTGATLVIIALPVALLAAIVVNLVRLFRDRSERRAGARLKTRLLVFFVFVALLALVPQALLSTAFINSAINYWLSAGVGDALESGLAISLAYHTDKVRNLRSFASGPVLAHMLEDFDRNPEQAWRNITSADPEIGVMQVFDAGGREVFFRGDEKARGEDPAVLRRDLPGVPVRKTRGDTTILRVVVPATGTRAGGPMVVLAIVYPRTFDEQASRITEARRVARQLAEYRQLFRNVVAAFYVLFSIPILLLAILVSFVLSEDIIRPIVHLEDATRRVADGDFSFRLLARRNDELAALVGSFNRMIGELETSRRKLVHAEKVETWKEIAQRLAHEIRNPLTPIKLAAQRILRKAETTAPRELKDVLEPAVNAIVKEVDNLNKLLVGFREFTRLPDFHPAPVDVRGLIDEVVSVYRNLSQNVSFECHYAAQSHALMADKDQLHQALANLVKNAIQAMPQGGKVVVATDLVTKDQSEYLRVRIQDNGEGMDGEARAKAFQPYFTTKREGSGLGLPIVERIIFDHNGRIWFETEKGRGTTFTFDLPAVQPPAAAPSGGAG
jgi:two-component system, NtrC family, nitrogen regulation sensor histidine kinase NtrY